MDFLRSFILLSTCVFVSTSSKILMSDDIHILPDGRLPNDNRLKPLKDLDGYFPLEVPSTRAAWERRRAQVRRRVLVSAGLWPMPERTPLNAVIFGRVVRDDFTIEKVYFESVPGHYVTGLLFRPKGKRGRLPGVLCPYGHNGRLQDHGPRKIRQLIVEGRERFEGSGRYPKLARCVQLARMGCVTFIYDMLGYADSLQIHKEVAHELAQARPQLDTPQRWGLFSTQAELRLQSSFGIQTYNSIRALDFLCGLPDVDPNRIGVTGSSGGGAQTFFLCAVDPRPAVSFPQGMVATTMQGTCLCENACYLRIGTGNVELAALFAPKPMGLTAAGDWTHEMMTKGYPELQNLYELLGAKENVYCKSLVHFPHNYNYVTRAVMYSWFNQHLQLGWQEPIVEKDFIPLTSEEWTVWNDQHPIPEGGDEYEVSLTRWLEEQSNQQLDAIRPTDADALKHYRTIVGGALETIIGRDIPAEGRVKRETIAQEFRGELRVSKELIHLEPYGEELPVLWIYSQGATSNGQLILWVDGKGKKGLFDSEGMLRAELRTLLAQGFTVGGIDLFMQGELLPDGKLISQTRVHAGPQPSAVYTFCYNHPLFVQRVHDIMTVVSAARKNEKSSAIHLVGVGGAGPIVAAASVQLGDAIERRIVDTDGFRFANIRSYRDVNFLPGSVKYGDLPAILALSAPHPLWIAGEGDRPPELVEVAYRASGNEKNVHSIDGNMHDLIQAAFGN